MTHQGTGDDSRNQGVEMNNCVAKWIAVLLALVAPKVLLGQEFLEPTTSFFSVSDTVHPTEDGQLGSVSVAGFYTPAAGNVAPKVVVLPRIRIYPDRITAIDTSGRSLPIDRVAAGVSVRTVKVPVVYDGGAPSQSEGMAIAASISGQRIDSLVPNAMLDQRGQPILWDALRTPRDRAPFLGYVQHHQRMVGAQLRWLGRFQQLRTEVAPMDGLRIELLIDGEIFASQEYMGSTIPLGGRLPDLTVREPSPFIMTRLREGTFDVQLRYLFNDRAVGTITADYDFGRFMSEYLEESRRAVTTSRASGFRFFTFGSRRSRIRTFMDESIEHRRDDRTHQRTSIMIENADEELMEIFMSQFFPEVTRTQVVRSHLEAAERASKDGKAALARAHMDYARAVEAGAATKEVDAIAAAAKLAAGDYAGFVAEGVRYSQSSGSISNTFHRVVSKQASVTGQRDWTITRRRIARRAVTVLVASEPKDEALFAYMGLLSFNFAPVMVPDGYSGRPLQRMALVPTVIAMNSPLARAGVPQGIAIIGIDGERVETKEDYDRVWDAYRPGDRITLTVVDYRSRSGTSDITVTLSRGVRRER